MKIRDQWQLLSKGNIAIFHKSSPESLSRLYRQKKVVNNQRDKNMKGACCEVPLVMYYSLLAA